ncbi:CaiB/BaiF CoA-transferase family protein [Hyphomonas sp. ND6WE1B]|uniref:CaiB/BaiF CoA transferase family protein n=1 Tax=Hyphomonas sp. ND6WE1B TaxID=1848191 RepID=UPI0008075D4D|nr:CaiB/BaiF CoA-transferase family protein [Hyphomonas sp. ND6WE1B]
MRGPLHGIRVIEIEAIGPAPFSGMHLADLGADVILVERKHRNSDPASQFPVGILKRGKRSIVLDFKTPDDLQTVLDLIKTADALIEGMRPGVMERLGLGPEICMQSNPGLVYARMTGWGQHGPLSKFAGHDINYAAITSAAWYASSAGTPPLIPPGLVGDIGGGANYLTIGILAGILKSRSTGRGDVVDAAIVDGTAHMMNLLFDLLPSGMMKAERGQSMLDGAPWYGIYRCADGADIALGALEPKFYAELMMRLGLADDPDFEAQFDRECWPRQVSRLKELFASRPRAHWHELLNATDACFAPIESPVSAPLHPHNMSRQIFDESAGFVQAAVAPRFHSTPASSRWAIPGRGEHTEEVVDELRRWGASHTNGD